MFAMEQGQSGCLPLEQVEGGRHHYELLYHTHFHLVAYFLGILWFIEMGCYYDCAWPAPFEYPDVTLVGEVVLSLDGPSGGVS